MSEADRPAPEQGYQASSLVVSPRPNEFGFALREDEFQILCDGALSAARASRDLSIGILVGAVVGVGGVFATTDWATIWQPEKRGPFLFWVGLLLLGIAASATAAVIYHQRLETTSTNSAYARLTQKITTWFTAAQRSGDTNPLIGKGSLVIISAKYGVGDLCADVTDRLVAKIQNGNLSVAVTNQELGTDPAPNTWKSLEVKYEYEGKFHSKTVRENQILLIPEP